MDSEPTSRSAVASLLQFWIGYVALALVAGFLTNVTIASEVWQHIAWGLITSLGLIYLTRRMMRSEGGSSAKLNLALCFASLRRFSFGVLLGVASFDSQCTCLS